MYLVQQPIIEWVGPADNVLSNSSGIIIGEQVALGNNVTRTLTFSSLKYEHKGQYACRTKCVEITSQSFTIKVIGKNIILFFHFITHKMLFFTLSMTSL